MLWFSIIRPHRNTTYVVRPIVTDPIAWSVCQSVCLSVALSQSWALQKGWTDRDAVWVVHSDWPKEPCVRWGAHWRNLANTIEPSMCGGDAAIVPNYFDHLFYNSTWKIFQVLTHFSLSWKVENFSWQKWVWKDLVLASKVCPRNIWKKFDMAQTRRTYKLTFSGNFINRCMRFLGHVTENGENDEAGKEACYTVDTARRYGIPTAYVIALVSQLKWSQIQIDLNTNTTQQNGNAYHFNHTNYYLFNVNYKSFNKIRSLVSEIGKFKKLSIRISFSNMSMPTGYWTSCQWRQLGGLKKWNKKASIRWQDRARRQFQAGLRGDVGL